MYYYTYFVHFVMPSSNAAGDTTVVMYYSPVTSHVGINQMRELVSRTAEVNGEPIVIANFILLSKTREAPKVNHNDTHKLVDKDGNEVNVGDTLNSFRSLYTFDHISRHPDDGTATSGKIVVRDLRIAEGQPLYMRELYPSVFNCTIQPRQEGPTQHE